MAMDAQKLGHALLRVGLTAGQEIEHLELWLLATIVFMLTAQRDAPAAKRFFTKAIRRHGVPQKVTIDGGEATVAIIRQVKYLTNIVEQDHRAVKRLTRPMRGFKSCEAA